MARAMLVNVVNEEESRIAIVSGGLLEELSIETSRHEQIEGNIYKAKIVKVIASLDAVFVDYGRERNGFLAMPDIHPRYFSDGPRDINRLKRGQELMVQVRKGEIGQKGAALTTYVSIPGRYFVLMPFVTKRGVSRKIQDDATRQQLRQILDDAGVPEDMGYIARTAAEGRTKQDLQRDASYLVRLWKRIQSQADSSKAPALLYQDTDIVIRTIRDYFTPSIREVWVDDKAVFEQVQSFFQAVMPWHQKRVRLYSGKGPLFSKYNLEAQIASIYEKTVPLPSGGSIVIEQTEALVSIDVNSGKTTKGKDIEETAFIANREAADEAVRQLRLRDLGGLIVIDFIDMRSASHRNEIRKVLQKALKEDKARTDTGTISKFGMLELSRQRIKPAGTVVGVTSPCPVCSGKGKVRSAESFSLAILRMIQAELARAEATTQVLVGVPAEAATLLLNRKRAKIVELETGFKVGIAVFAEPALHPNQYYLEFREGTAKRIDTNLPDSVPRALLKTPEGLPEVTVRAQRPPSYAVFEDEEPLPEVPAEPPDEAEAVAEGGAQEEKPAKKKRRRRKKKAEEAATSAAPGGPATEKAEAGEAPAAPEPPTEPAGEEEEPPPSPTEAEAPARPLSASAKRRLRRKRRKEREAIAAAGAPAEGTEPEAPAAEPGPPPATAEAAPEPAPAAEPPGEKPEPRKRHRRSRKKPAEHAPAAASGGEAPASRAESEAVEEPAAPPTTPASVPAPEPPTPAPATAPAEASGAESEEAPAKRPPRRKRAPRKAKPAEGSEPAPAAEPPPPAEKAEPATGDAEEEKTPRRRPRTTRKRKPAAAETAESGSGAEESESA